MVVRNLKNKNNSNKNKNIEMYYNIYIRLYGMCKISMQVSSEDA